MQKEKVPDLVALGMTEREAKLYVAMMEKPEWRASELQRITGIQRTHVHRALEVMVSRQYCIKRSEGRFNFYRATPPNTLEEILTHRWEDEMVNRIDRVRSTMKTLNNIFEVSIAQDRSLDFIEIVQTPHRIHQRFTELLRDTKQENLSINRSPYSFISETVLKKNLDQQVDANLEIAQKGVKLRTLVMYEPDIWHHLEPVFDNNVMNSSEEMRVADFIPVKMSIFDSDKVMMCVNSVSAQQDIVVNEIILHDTLFATACTDLFNLYWSRAVPYKDWKTNLKR